MSGTSPGWVTLTDDESIVWSGGPSILSIVGSLAVEVGIAVVGVVLFVLLSGETPLFDLGPLALVLVPIGLVLAALTYLRYRSVEYLITTEEVYVKRGVISRTVRNLRLGRIQDTGFEQSVLQRAFGFGDVYVSTAGSGGVEVVLSDVPEPAEVNGVLAERLSALCSDAAASG